MVDKNEDGVKSKSDRFIDSAAKRTDEVLQRIKVLGNCSNTGLYQYNEDQVRKIFKAVDAQLRDTKERFRQGLKKNENRQARQRFQL